MVQPLREPTRPVWQPDRMPMPMPLNPPPPEEDRYSAQRPMDICTMLETYCRIPVEHFIMAAISKEGKVVTYAGSLGGNAINEAVLPAYIDLQGYQNWYFNGQVIPSPSPSSEDHYHGSDSRGSTNANFGRRRQYGSRRPQGPVPYDDEAPFRTKKRPRAGVYRRETNNATDDDTPAVQVVHSKKAIRIGNDKDVWKFCDQRFKNIQQTACKMVAKAWVKAIAPKKQSNHPYTGADARAPDWWPKPWGPTRDERVRHKEPDHLLKPERVHLLNHILGMIVKPNAAQHPDIQKLNLNVAKLEEAALEALSGFFGDTEHPNNSRKKPYLKEIFKVARHQEKYLNGQIDAETEVFVMADDKIPADWEEDDEETGVPRDDDENEPMATTSSISPPKTSDQSMLPAPVSNDHSPAGNIQNEPFLGTLPVRGGHHYHQPSLMQPDLSGGQSGFGESGSMGVNGQTSMPHPSGMSLQDSFPDSHHPSSRRTSLYASPSEFANAATHSGMYNTSWQTTAPSNPSPIYSFHQQQQQQHAHPPSPYAAQPPVPMTANAPYLGTASFDGLSRAPYDTGSTGMYRAANLSQGPSHQHQTQQGFPNYPLHDPRSSNNGDEPSKYENTNEDEGIMPSPWPARQLPPRR